MILGYVFAVLAAVASGSGSILASIGIRRAGAYAGRSRDLIGVGRQPFYWFGLGVDVLGFLFAAAALHRLPLFLVQSVLAFSVGVTAIIAAILGTRLAPAGWGALGLGALGLVLLGVSADPGPGKVLDTGWRWALVATVIPVLAIAIYARRRTGFWAAPMLAFGAGLGYSFVGIAARTLHIPDSIWPIVFEPTAWAIPLNGIAAAVLFAMALQKSGATAVTAIMFTTNSALSSLIGLVYLDDGVRIGFEGAAVAGFIFAIAGAIGAAHYAAVARQPTQTPTPS
ncbi:hypothetical protein [Amycolatopsis magusensis]|uniref:hypothetical protein n=1 Tax=Amycolatopsis magusensis TaxID=882444 RepID=UPI003C304059